MATGQKKGKSKNRNQHEPIKLSSKIPVGVLRQVIQSDKPKISDPRFDNACGKFNRDLFEKSFSFIGEIQKSEIKKLTDKPIRSLKEKKKLDQFVSLQHLKNKRDHIRNTTNERKKIEKDLISQGKKPFFLKKSEIKKLEIMNKYKELCDNDASIDKAIEKKRKNRSSNQRRHLPPTFSSNP